MRYTPQLFYCNACGREMHVEYGQLMGREWKVCSPKCIEDMQLRRAKSILGEE